MDDHILMSMASRYHILMLMASRYHNFMLMAMAAHGIATKLQIEVTMIGMRADCVA